MTAPINPQQPGFWYPAPQVPNFVPQPVTGYQVLPQNPQYPTGQQMPQNQQPQNQPQHQQQQPQYTQGQLNTVLDGADVPPVLRGRTIRDALGLFSEMQRRYVESLNQQRAGGQVQTVQPPAGNQQQQPQRTREQFFNDPFGSLETIIDQKLQTALKPVTEHTVLEQVKAVRDRLAQTYGQEFLQYEGQVMQKLQSMPPEYLVREDTWLNALNMVVGENIRVRQQQQQPNGQQQTQQPNGQVQQQHMPFIPGQQPPVMQQQQPMTQQVPQVQQMPAQQQIQTPQMQVTPMGQFFTEQPNANAPTQQQIQYTAEDVYWANKMNVSIQDYVTSKASIAQGRMPQLPSLNPAPQQQQVMQPQNQQQQPVFFGNNAPAGGQYGAH